ncbi:hypothetical protein [Paraburkholderia tropica]|uniref:hypothetical protein n=1 Tax=Paraburkholderia tropica TaxID=92647 RepID=UPI002AB06765|nr:hypothetical protein [Paraburkholderia tropica]
MYRIDDATASTSLPTPEAAGTEGYFTEGNPATGTPATKVRGSWLNMIQEELRALVVYGGLTPSKTVYTQIRDAIVAKFAKINGDSTQLFSVAAPTASQHAAQFANIGNFQGLVSVTGAYTIPSSGFGYVYQPPTGNTGGFTITFPSASGNNGKVIAVFNSSSGNITLSAANFNSAYGSGASIVMPPGSTGIFTCDGTSFNGVGGSAGAGSGPRPQSASGVGQWATPTLSGSGASTYWTLPSGGTWAYFVSNNGSSGSGIAAGGTNVMGPFTASNSIGFCWRIA